MVIDTVQTFFNALKRWKFDIMAHCTYIVNKKDEPANENFVKNYAKVSTTKQERRNMKGSVGVSMGGTIEYVKSKKKKPPKRNCQRCKNFSNGYCTKHNLRPTTIELEAKCISFESKKYGKKTKTKKV